MAIVIQRLWVRLNLKMNQALAWFLTFNFVNASWVFFRAKKWEDALKVLKGMTGLNHFGFKNITEFKIQVLWIVTLFAVVILAKNTSELRAQFKPNWKSAAFCLLLAVIGIMNLTKVSEFIYFNF